mmetsp:Transcript_16578/g.46456  ORF Transcript_16578/g.46456 Transcript_16578/m.46456 type:complete len:135 (-) Transcript_16578:72-476(-)
MAESESIVEKVKKYFYEDDSFEATFMEWARSNADAIALDKEEMRLEYTHLHESFLKFFEEQMEKFITDAGSTSEDFYRELKANIRENGEGEDHSFVQIMMAAIEFNTFMQMMREAKLMKDEEEAALFEEASPKK